MDKIMSTRMDEAVIRHIDEFQALSNARYYCSTCVECIVAA